MVTCPQMGPRGVGQPHSLIPDPCRPSLTALHPTANSQTEPSGLHGAGLDGPLHSPGRVRNWSQASPLCGAVWGPQWDLRSPRSPPWLLATPAFPTAHRPALCPEEASAQRELSGEGAGQCLLRKHGTWGQRNPKCSLYPHSGRPQPVFRAQGWVSSQEPLGSQLGHGQQISGGVWAQLQPSDTPRGPSWPTGEHEAPPRAQEGVALSKG